MIYRAWKYEDILEITRLEETCFQAERWNYQMFASSFEQKGFFGDLCEEEGVDGEKQLIAYGCVQCVEDTADLLTIAVHPDCRGRGIGKTMLDRLISGAKRRGTERMFLEVRESNAPALSLYLSEGFEKVSVRKKYYPDGENALVLVKKL
ncbi:MAG: ribosomal protein S18-alanine N-acetyltransferase [Clostridia bacterium]|nr:ribosomal protein S18-alanine N-acetyltransferase [Clostridia bacterium]